MLVLALDPGTRTGLALVGKDCKVLRSETLSQELLEPRLALLHFSHPEITHIVIEHPPHKTEENQAAWFLVRQVTQRLFGSAKQVEIGPGVWKPLASVLKKPGDKFKTDHERDAIYLARYVIRGSGMK